MHWHDVVPGKYLQILTQSGDCLLVHVFSRRNQNSVQPEPKLVCTEWELKWCKPVQFLYCNSYPHCCSFYYYYYYYYYVALLCRVYDVYTSDSSPVAHCFPPPTLFRPKGQRGVLDTSLSLKAVVQLEGQSFVRKRKGCSFYSLRLTGRKTPIYLLTHTIGTHWERRHSALVVVTSDLRTDDMQATLMLVLQFAMFRSAVASFNDKRCALTGSSARSQSCKARGVYTGGRGGGGLHWRVWGLVKHRDGTRWTSEWQIKIRSGRITSLCSVTSASGTLYCQLCIVLSDYIILSAVYCTVSCTLYCQLCIVLPVVHYTVSGVLYCQRYTILSAVYCTVCCRLYQL